MASNKRLWILIAVAVVLALAFLAERQGWPQGAAPVLARADSPAEILYRKQASLQRYAAHREEIDDAYQKLAPLYAERAVEWIGLMPAGTADARAFAETTLRQKIESSGLAGDVRVTVAEPESPVPHVKLALADIGFTTGSSQLAKQLLTDLGAPQHGAVWRNFTLSTDRAQKQITLSGRLALLLAEEAE